MALFDPVPEGEPECIDDDYDDRPRSKAENLRLLQRSVPLAIRALRQAMRQGDHAEAVKAALGILDRAGYGPKSTLQIEDLPEDLSSLSEKQLAERAERIAKALKGDTVH